MAVRSSHSQEFHLNSFANHIQNLWETLRYSVKSVLIIETFDFASSGIRAATPIGTANLKVFESSETCESQDPVRVTLIINELDVKL